MNEKLRNIMAASTSFLAGLSALPYQLGDIATIIPPQWKSKLFLVCSIAALILRAIKPTADSLK
jgi:hypothetical protein